MRSRVHELAARREALVTQSEALRAGLLRSGEQARQSLGILQIAVAAARALRRHPIAVAAGTVAFMVVGPRRLVRMLGLGLGAWSLATRTQRLAGLARRFAQRG